MQSECKLILVEGLCGTGKSTLANRLHRHLVAKGLAVRFYDEGAEGHLASLNWHAFFQEEAYVDLIKRYPHKSNEIRMRAIKYGIHYLIPYREVKDFIEENDLYAELQSRELCWTNKPIATLSEFTYLIQRHWARFAELAGDSDQVYVLEAVFFQHQIHDLWGHYQATDSEIEQHIVGIADKLANLNPILIYLTQPSVREQQEWISSIRSKPRFATEENIKFMENRKRVEMKLLDVVSFPTYRIENVNLDWEDVFSKMVDAIEQKRG